MPVRNSRVSVETLKKVNVYKINSKNIHYDSDNLRVGCPEWNNDCSTWSDHSLPPFAC